MGTQLLKTKKVDGEGGKKKKDKNSKLFLCWRSHTTALSSINLEISKARYSSVER